MCIVLLVLTVCFRFSEVICSFLFCFYFSTVVVVVVVVVICLFRLCAFSLARADLLSLQILTVCVRVGAIFCPCARVLVCGRTEKSP